MAPLPPQGSHERNASVHQASRILGGRWEHQARRTQSTRPQPKPQPEPAKPLRQSARAAALPQKRYRDASDDDRSRLLIPHPFLNDKKQRTQDARVDQVLRIHTYAETEAPAVRAARTKQMLGNGVPSLLGHAQVRAGAEDVAKTGLVAPCTYPILDQARRRFR